MRDLYIKFEAGFNVPYSKVEKIKEAFYKTDTGQQDLKTPMLDETGATEPFNLGYAVLELLMEGIGIEELGIEFSDSVCNVDEEIPVEEV